MSAFIVGSCAEPSKGSFILPSNFRGIVVVLFDREDGVACAKVDGVSEYVIPESGVLYSKCSEPNSELNSGMDYRFYFVDDGDRNHPIELYISPSGAETIKPVDVTDPEKVLIYHVGYGGIRLTDGQSLQSFPEYKAGETVRWLEFWVGTAPQYDSLYAMRERLTTQLFGFSKSK